MTTKGIREELIGKSIEVEGKKIQGTIIDETKHTFTIETAQGNKKVTKKDNIFLISAKDGRMRINGHLLIARPEDRIKNW